MFVNVSRRWYLSHLKVYKILCSHPKLCSGPSVNNADILSIILIKIINLYKIKSEKRKKIRIMIINYSHLNFYFGFKLLQILRNRPMSISHDSSDLETDWRDSEFITECLCWHNVYRQRHNVPPLTMSPQVNNFIYQIERCPFTLQ